VQLKVFQSIGRFRPVAEIPDIAIEHVARRMGVEFPSSQIFPAERVNDFASPLNIYLLSRV
jgi:hypothetical protein